QLFCACDEGKLVAVHLDTGEVRLIGNLSGPPDVIFFNSALRRVYVAVGSPGVVDVLDVGRMKVLETVPTEKGAHTLAFDHRKNKVYAGATCHPPSGCISRRLTCGVVSDGSARDVYGSRRKRCEDVRRQCNDRSEERRAALP